jgi:hypothetical protein
MLPSPSRAEVRRRPRSDVHALICRGRPPRPGHQRGTTPPSSWPSHRLLPRQVPHARPRGVVGFKSIVGASARRLLRSPYSWDEAAQWRGEALFVAWNARAPLLLDAGTVVKLMAGRKDARRRACLPAGTPTGTHPLPPDHESGVARRRARAPPGVIPLGGGGRAGLRRDCAEIARGLRGIARGLHRDCAGIARGLHRDCAGIVRRLHGDCSSQEGHRTQEEGHVNITELMYAT